MYRSSAPTANTRGSMMRVQDPPPSSCPSQTSLGRSIQSSENGPRLHTFTTGVSAGELNSTSGLCELEVNGAATTQVGGLTLQQVAACRSEIISLGKTLNSCF
jgi:hypothetical protein